MEYCCWLSWQGTVVLNSTIGCISFGFICRFNYLEYDGQSWYSVRSGDSVHEDITKIGSPDDHNYIASFRSGYNTKDNSFVHAWKCGVQIYISSSEPPLHVLVMTRGGWTIVRWPEDGGGGGVKPEGLKIPSIFRPRAKNFGSLAWLLHIWRLLPSWRVPKTHNDKVKGIVQ